MSEVCETENLGNKFEVIRLQKKLEFLREEFEKAPLKKRHEMNTYFDKLAECLR